MARMDDFIQARAMAVKALEGTDIETIARSSGSALDKNGEGNVTGLALRFLNRDVIVSWPDMAFSYRGSCDEVPAQQQVLLLHYLAGACNAGPMGGPGEWISFQDIPEGRFYMDSFIKRAKAPLLAAFGADPERMAALASGLYDASKMEIGDLSVLVRALPMVPVVLVLWQGDDEFPPEGNILFDRNIPDILPAEDIALLAGMVVYPLAGMAKR